MVTLAIAVGTALVLWRGSLLVLSGAMTIGSLSIFLAYLARFFTPVRDLAQMTNTIAQVSVAFQRVTAVCDADTVIPQRPAPRQPAPFRGEIAFENVAFAYHTDVPVLQDIAFDVHPGQMEELVIDALEHLMKGRTVIAVAHRLSTLRNANKIVVIKDGIVAENGTHHQLLNLNGIYAQLHHLQYGDAHR